MRELTFVDLSADGTHVILMGNDGQQYKLAIDERLSAAARRDRSRIGQIEIESEGALRPRDIQARIRAGATAEEVAAQSGLPLERIRRFEGPVLTERAWVADQARATELRRPGITTTLNALVNTALDSHGVLPIDLRWDSWRRDDGRWTVQLLVPAGGGEAEALWVYDGNTRTLGWDNDLARSLTEGQPFDLGATAQRPILVAVPSADEIPDEIADEIADETADGTSGELADEAADGAQIIALSDEFAQDEENEDLAVDGLDFLDSFFADPVEDGAEADLQAELAEAEGRLGLVEFEGAEAIADESQHEGADAEREEGREEGREEEREDESEGKADNVVVLQPPTPTQSSLEDFLSEEDMGREAQVREPESPSDSPSESQTGDPTSAKPRRASVPSWDDILFGTKPITSADGEG